MIDKKDRGQLLRMAGNIASGLCATATDEEQIMRIPLISVKMALVILDQVDAEISGTDPND